MSDLVFPPGLVMIFGGLLVAVLPRGARPVAVLGAPILALWQMWTLGAGVDGLCPPVSGPDCAVYVTSYSYLGYELSPVRIDGLGLLFGTIFALAALLGGLFALPQRNGSELAAALVYAGGAVGAAFAGDLVTLFVFWEVMAIASTLVIWSGGPRARAAGLRYGIIHFLSGVLFMLGAAGHIGETGSVAFNLIGTESWAGWLILASVLINAGAPPLAAWLPDAYPSASWSGTVFLSAFTTKTSVYVLIRGFPGEEILLIIGPAMVIYGIVYAILENDMRRILAYSIVNQVGFMVTAVGVGSELALNGAAAHAFMHILYKALLLMSAGSVLYMTGLSRCTDLGGLFRSMPVACVCGIIGALAISAFPGTSGFVSKSMITVAIGEAGLLYAWLALTAASAAAFVYVGLNYPWHVFFHRDSGLRPEDPPLPMQAAMAITAVLCIGLGVWAAPLEAMLPFGETYDPYSAGKVVAQLQLLLVGGLVFFLLLRPLRRMRTITLDIDWAWRGGGRAAAREFEMAWIAAYARMAERALSTLQRGLEALTAKHRPDGIFGRTRSTGLMALWMTVLLTASILMSLV